uniref:Uncharacterized protein n=1 Tax=Tanacetum cinerariifolium TaxID=118510 RepID=A0A699IT78_TANCI|nr:hypothetical protein [Tanacetum cinerariifolium]
MDSSTTNPTAAMAKVIRLAEKGSSSFTLVDDTTVGTSFVGRSHFQGVPNSYGLRQGEIICADTPKEVTHWTADMPKEVTRSLGEVSSIRKSSRLPQLFQMRSVNGKITKLEMIPEQCKCFHMFFISWDVMLVPILGSSS